MTDIVPIRRALISLSDKSGLDELAAGLAKAGVELVSTGGTLKANNLVEVERIMDISSRLVVNQAALKLKQAPMRELIDVFRRATETAAA